jgi:hypothetical protein
MNTFAGATTSGQYLRGNGTNVVMASIVAGDVPTLNQNTTGSSGSCTGNAATATSAGNLTGGNITGNYIVGNATSPNSYYLQFGDNTGWNYRFMTNVAGTPTTRFTFGDNGNFTAVGTISGTNITSGGNVTGSSASCTGNAATATTATNQSGGTVAATTGSFSGAVTQSGNSYTTYGPNSSWSAYLRVGGNGRTVSGSAYASVVTTDGNLHIDAGDAKTTYINYYAGTGGIQFGNGASGTMGNMTAAGALTMNSNITAYSDERLKTNWRPVADSFVEKLAQVKAGVYKRTDIEVTQAGVSAQSLQKLLPEAVLEGNDEEKYLSVAYGNAALVSAVELAKELVALKELVKELKAEVDELKKAK